ncbi:D-apionate lactonase [Rhizobium sp. Leaf341]|uniref:D-apionate lactonase n=1 Tax=Rhizobium sp. Leaf341 TaxID=1736344 RepID=UPI0007142D88|nr:hypothetical protein [Rhizobium sp. Leaf341]KQR77961.1 hypothetical protein ASG03_16570 [Rhizobium sp. Leaf341]
MTRDALAFRLTGTFRTEPDPLVLIAGGLSAEFSGGALRNIRYEGVEVLRAISFLVRDRDWGTYDPEIADLVVDQHANGFTVSYGATCLGPDGTHLDIKARIDGESDGRLRFSGTARSDTGFETNRCGFCVLHPIVGVAGSAVRIEHVDGTLEDTVLPDLIEPWQPFKDMRAITHLARPGVKVECRMEGDTFEMEDQRNWSDASYKTYVRPLALPWPYHIAAGAEVEQAITLQVMHDAPSLPVASLAAQTAAPIKLSLTEGSAQKLPPIGLIITPEEAVLSQALLEAGTSPGAQALLFPFDPLAGHDAAVFGDFAALAAGHRGSTTLEIALPCRSALDEELGAIAAAMHMAGFAPDAIMVSPAVDRQSTPPGSPWPECPPLEDVYAAARSVFPSAMLGGGMLSYFTELNRKRVPADNLDFISHCTNPIVHAGDDHSVMQTLEALPFITRSVRAIYGDRRYRIGPSTIPMRQNPYGSRTMDNPGGSRIPMANRDPRQTGLFAAAYAVGYAISVAPAGLDQLTLSALTGPFGLMAGAGEPVAEGGRRPLFHVVSMLADLAGAMATILASSQPDHVLGMRAEREGSLTILLGNLTPLPQMLDLSALDIPAHASVSRLDAETMLSSATGALRADVLENGNVMIGGYGVLRIDA